jgi:hypothetical protein
VAVRRKKKKRKKAKARQGRAHRPAPPAASQTAAPFPVPTAPASRVEAALARWKRLFSRRARRHDIAQSRDTTARGREATAAAVAGAGKRIAMLEGRFQSQLKRIEANAPGPGTPRSRDWDEPFARVSSALARMAQQTRADAEAARAVVAERGAAAGKPTPALDSMATAHALRLLAAERVSQREECAARARDEHGHAEEWRTRAELAIVENDDDLAREALAHAREHDQLAALHARDADTERRIIDELLAAASELESRTPPGG